MAELKPFEVIMRLSPYAAQNKNEICFHTEKVTELVRCKDCKHADIFHQSERVEFWKRGDDFCSRGERREHE